MTPDQYRREGAEAMREAALYQCARVQAELPNSPRMAFDLGLHSCESAIRAIDADEVLAEIPTEWPAPMPITMTYRNWRGETSERTIIPSRIWFGQTEWHPDVGWMLSAFDLGKRAHRDFALADCQFKTENK